MLQRVLFLVLVKDRSACMKKIFLRYASEKTKCDWLSVKDLWCGIYSTYKPGIKLNWAGFFCLFVLFPCRLSHSFIGEQKITSLFSLFLGTFPSQRNLWILYFLEVFGVSRLKGKKKKRDKDKVTNLIEVCFFGPSNLKNQVGGQTKRIVITSR